MAVTILGASSNGLTSTGSRASISIAGGSFEGTTEYLFIFSGWAGALSGSQTSSVDTTGLDLNPTAVYIDTAQRHRPFMFARVFTTAASPVAVTLGVTRTAGSGTVFLLRTSIIAIKTADLTDFSFSQESSLQDVGHSTTMVSRRNTALAALTSGQRYGCLASIGVQIDATNVNTEAEITDDAGTPVRQSFQSYEGEDAAEVYYTGLMEVFDGANSATADPRRLRSRDDGGGGKNDYEYGFICHFEIPGGSVDSSNWENGDGAQTDGDVNIGTGFTEVQGVVPTVADSAEYLWLVAATIDVQNASRSFTAQVQEGGTDLYSDTPNIDPNDATDELPTFFAKYETALTPGTTFNLDYDLLADSTTGTPHASFRTAIALQATAVSGAQTVNPEALAQPVSFGNVMLVRTPLALGLAQPVTVSSLVTLELQVEPPGLPQPASFGIPTLNLTQDVTPPGLAEPVTVSILVTLELAVAPPGLAQPVSFGNVMLVRTPLALGLAQPVTVSTLVTLELQVEPPGLAEPVSFGVPTLQVVQTVSPPGLAQPVTVSTLVTLELQIEPPGLPEPVTVSTLVTLVLEIDFVPGLAQPVSFGVPTISVVQTVTPPGLAEPVTVSTLVTLELTVAPPGLAQPVSFGVPGISNHPVPPGLAQPVTVSTLVTLELQVEPSGLPQPVSFGVPTINIVQSVTPPGLAEPVTVSTLVTLELQVEPSGLPQPVSFGVPTLAPVQDVTPSGLAQPVTVSILVTLELQAEPPGLAEPVTVSVLVTLELQVEPPGLPQPVSFGIPGVTTHPTPPGLAQPVSFGVPTVTVVAGDQNYTPPGLAEPVTVSTLVTLELTVAPSGLAQPAAFGVPTLIALVSPSGLVLVAAFGTPSLESDLVVPGLALVVLFGQHRIVLPIFATGTLGAFSTGSATLAANSTGTGTLPAFSTGTGTVDGR